MGLGLWSETMPEAMPSAMLSFELSALPMLNCTMLNYALCAMLNFEC